MKYRAIFIKQAPIILVPPKSIPMTAMVCFVFI